MVCHHCAKEIKSGSVFCPYCGQKVSAVQKQSPAPTAPVPRTTTPTPAITPAPRKKRLVLILSLTCAAVLIIALTVLAFIFHWFGLGVPAAKDAYADYLVNGGVYSVIDTSSDKTEAFGIVSVLMEDVTGDDIAEMFAVLADTDASHTGFYLTSFSYDKKTGKVNKTAEQPAFNAPANKKHAAQTQVYRVTANNKDYFVYEHLQTASENSTDYYASVFSIDTEGVPVQEGSLVYRQSFEYNTNSCTVYSENVPKGMKAYTEKTDLYNGNPVFYAQTDNEKKADYYSSSLEAVNAFFNAFDITSHPKADSIEDFAKKLQADNKITTCEQTTGKDGNQSYAYTDYTQLDAFVKDVKKDTAPANKQEEAEESREVGEAVVNKLTSKIEFPNNEYIVPSMLEDGGLDVEKCSNEQILRVAFASIIPQIDITQKTDSSGAITSLTKEVSAAQMKEAVQNIFGDIPYTDESFETYNTQSPFLNYCNMLDTTVTFSDGVYRVESLQGGGGDLPYIDMIYSRCEKEGNTYKVYVKPVFVDIGRSKENAFIYYYYQDYRNGACYNRLKVMNSTEVYEILSASGDLYKSLLMQPTPVYEDIFDDLTEYCYTFEQTDSLFVLKSFSLSASPIDSALQKQIDTVIKDKNTAFHRAFTEDYDGDGIEEAFAICGETADMFSFGTAFVHADLYFITQNGSELLDSDIYGYTKSFMYDAHYTFFSYEQSAGGSGSSTLIYSVKDGKPVKLDLSVMDVFQSAADHKYYGLDQSFDKGYHDYIRYEYTFDESSFRFVKGSRVD